MTDASVAQALRTDAGLVLIEAPAGCGKTHQAAEYAHWVATTSSDRVLILTHTHAACDVFRARTQAVRQRVHISTIDSLIAELSSTYHAGLGLPRDTAAWARSDPKRRGFERLAEKVAKLLAGSSAVCSAVVARYPLIVCDEHQDANLAQHRVVMLLFERGAKLRVFGDLMQSIYVTKRTWPAHQARWEELRARADRYEQLDTPHRWTSGTRELGDWVLHCRAELLAGNPVRLNGDLPVGLNVVRAHNISQSHTGFAMDNVPSRKVGDALRTLSPLLILSTQNETVRAVRAHYWRLAPVWEGHTREALTKLVQECDARKGDPAAIATAACSFVQATAVGFTPSAFGKRFVAEVQAGASRSARGAPKILQDMAKCVLGSPDHVGAAAALRVLKSAIESEAQFNEIKIDLPSEFMEGLTLGSHATAADAFNQLSVRRSSLRQRMPDKVFSTVHKAKGLESEHVIVLPCDKKHFADSPEKRCLLYVALSRAKSSLTLVTSPLDPTPLLLG